MSNPDTSVCVGAIVEEESADASRSCARCAMRRAAQILGAGRGGRARSDLGDRAALCAVLRCAARELAVRLQRDLGVNTAGVALVIELLERIEALERQLRD